MLRRPIIAVVPMGHHVYFSQFEGLKDALSRKTDEFVQYFSPEADVFAVDYVDTLDAAFEAVRRVKASDADAVFLLLTTYLPSALAAPFAVYLDAPVLLAGVQPLNHLDYENCTTYMQLANDDICAMPEIAGVFTRLGRACPACIVAASGETDRIRREIGLWERAVAAKAAFKYAKFGYLGHTYEGMYDMHTDSTAFTRYFGAHVTMLEMCELMRLADECADDDIAMKLSEIARAFEIRQPSADPVTDVVQETDLAFSARMACALDKLIENNGLRALAYYYKGEPGGEYERAAANLILGNTLLTSKGVPLAGEADLKTAAAMLIMHSIGGGGSFAELHPFDIDDDIVLIGHDGPHNIAISEGKPILRKLRKYHGKPGSGIGVEFSIRSGPVTLLSINARADGSFKLVAALGESLPGAIPQTGNTNTRVRFPMPATEFITKWSEAAPTHHLALGTGDHIEEIRRYARLAGLALEVIGSHAKN